MGVSTFIELAMFDPEKRVIPRFRRLFVPPALESSMPERMKRASTFRTFHFLQSSGQ